MGHKRLGFLPKTKKWRDIVSEIGEYTSESDTIAIIAKRTLNNVKSRFDVLEADSGVKAAFKFLVYLSYSSKFEDPLNFFKSKGIIIQKDATPLQLAKAIGKWINDNADSLEYASLAKSATIDAIAQWHQNHLTNQENLFGDNDTFEVWRKTSDGAGFCELSRIYFSKFTERYLKYFLEREASSEINDINERNLFNSNLERHIDTISKHSFEISKITQSYAAGWFNKNVRDEFPTDRKIQLFIGYSFSKLRAELTIDQIDE